MAFLSIVHVNSCQIMHLVWKSGNLNSCQITYNYSREQRKEAGGAWLSNPRRLYRLFYSCGPDSRPASGKQSQPSESGLPVSWASSSSARAVHAAGQLRSPPRSPLPPWPHGVAPPWSASSFPPPPGWAPEGDTPTAACKLSSLCAGVGLSKTTKRFALDSLAFFFF